MTETTSPRAMSNALINVIPPNLNGRPARVTLRNGVVAIDQSTPEGVAVAFRLRKSPLIGAFGHSFDLDNCPFASDLYDCLIQAFGTNAVTVLEGWPEIQSEYQYQPPDGAVI